MKISSFKKFIKEDDSKAIVKTGVNSVGVDNTITREILNSRLANVTRAPFLTPYIALGSIARVLAYASIVVPQYTFLDRDEGEVVFDANQFGKTVGIKIDGTPEDEEETDYYVYFSYSMNDDGFYDCFAALVDSEGLEKILDMDDDVVDKVDTHQEIEKMHENISEASFQNQNVFRPTPSPEQRRNQYRQQRQDRTPQTTPQTSTKSIETPKDRVDRLNRPGYNPPPKTPSRPTIDDRSTREPSSVVPRSDRSTREPSSVVPRSDRSTREPSSVVPRSDRSTREPSSVVPRSDRSTRERTPAPRNLPPAPRDGEEPSAAVPPMRRSTPAPSPSASAPRPSAPAPRPAAPSTQAQRSEPQYVPGEPQQSAPSRPQAAPRPSASAPRPAAPNYPVYKRDSEEAKSFRDAFGAARKSGQKEFEFQGRKYGTQLAKPSTSAPSQTAQKQSAPASGADDSDNKPDVRLPMAPSDQFGKNKITPTKTYNPNTGETKPIEDEKINERKMTKPEMEERERIVRRLKDKMVGFKKRYGKRAKDVMYATATKMAMEELKGDQHKIDANKNGKIDADDFKKLRGEKSVNERKSSDPKGLAYKVTAASHAANPQWGPADHTQDPKTHFGTAATRSSTLAAVRSIRAQRSQGGFDANNPQHVDAAAKAVHGSPQDYEGKPKGWSQTAMTHSGQSPEQKERRAKLTGPYGSLSEPEQQKDREIVGTVAANMPANMPTKKSK